MKKDRDTVLILHILDNIEAVEIFSKELSKDEFFENRLKRSAITREVEIVGESSKNLSKKLKEELKEIPWKKISGTRDILIHRYFGVDFNIIWDLVKVELPKLKKSLLKV